MKRVTLLLRMLAISVMFCAAMLSPALADTVLELTQGNTALLPYAPPYGTVNVHLVDSNTATFTFTAASGYLFGGAQIADVNVNGAFTYISDSSTELNQGAAGNADGWGAFNLTTDNFDGFTHAVSTLWFTIDKNSGTWANSDAVLTPNADGHKVAAHIFVIGADGAAATGFATDGPSKVPEASALLLFGSGLVGMVMYRRRKRLQ